MSTLDKYIFKSLATNYLIALGVMISLYVVLDLFFNMDEFTETGAGIAEVAVDVCSFYSARIFLYFAQLSGVITLFACLVTLALMRRNNELIAMLSSGVSLYRVAAPVVVFSLLTTGLWYLDTESVIPSIAHKLARRHDDARGLNTYGVWFLNDRDGALLSAQQYDPIDQKLRRLLVMTRSEDGGVDSVIEADEASWETHPSGTGGRWVLERGTRRSRSGSAGESLGPRGDLTPTLVRYYESDLDPLAIQMRQSAGWISFLSSGQLSQLEETLNAEGVRQVKKTKHVRFTTPLIHLLMLLMGLPFILDRSPADIVTGGTRCLLLCGLCFLIAFVSQNMQMGDRLSALPAWAPIIIFAPVTVVLIDRIRT